jgi:hypothetical protein
MNGQNMGEVETQTLDVMDQLIEITTAQFVHWIDRLHDLAAQESCIIEPMRVIMIIESALSSLIEERDLLALSELVACARVEASTDPQLLSHLQSLNEALQRRKVQISVIASLAGQEKAQDEAWQQLHVIEMTIRQAQENYALVKFLAETE